MEIPVRNYHVLLVEDSPDQADLMRDYLALQPNFDLDWAQNLQSAWDFLNSSSYDVILLDYMLPDGTGLDMLEKLEENKVEIPVIMVTGQGDERVAAQTIQKGAVDYLVKGGDYFTALPALIGKVRRHADLEEEIQTSLRQIRYQSLLLENIRDAVVVWDGQGIVTYWNPAAEMMLGSQAGDCLAHPVDEVYSLRFNPPIQLQDIHKDLDKELERQIFNEQAPPIWVSSRVTCLVDDQGQLLGYMDVLRDITERKRLEYQIQAATVQLTQSARMAAIGELSSGVAHRIYNPLTSVIANSQILKQELPADSGWCEIVEDIEKAGWNAQRVVQQLLDFSRPGDAERRDLWVNETIQAALRLIGGQLETAEIKLELFLTEDLPLVHGNLRQIEDVWVNLFLLARDSQPHKIWVRTYAKEQQVVVEFFDDGRAVPPEELPKLFEPNFVSQSIGRGTGLELSICREIVRQHHGQMRASSSSRVNLFQVILPAIV
jgi:PAS domain S-box-containing protein